MTYRVELLSMYSDLYKDVNGHRPRYIDTDKWSELDLQSQLTKLEGELQLLEIFEAQAAGRAIEAFKTLLGNTMATCSCSASKAVEYLMDAESLEEHEWGYFCYTNGLPHGYARPQ